MQRNVSYIHFVVWCLSCVVLFLLSGIILNCSHNNCIRAHRPKTLKDLFVFPDESSACQVQLPGSVTQVSYSVSWCDKCAISFLAGSFKFSKRNHYIIALSDIIIKSKTHILFISHTHLEVWTDFSLACLMTFTPFCLQGAHAAERRHRLHPQAGRCQLVWRGTSRQSWHFPHNLRGGKYLHIISRHCSTVLVIWFPLTQTCYRCPS